MTREEAIKTLKENYCAMCAYGSQDMDSCDIRSCDNKDAIKALEQEPCEVSQGLVKDSQGFSQEPCEDTVSRQAVHETIEKWAGSMAVLVALPTREVRPLLDSIHKLPSVTPQQKTGKWIDDKCSVCGKGIENLIDSREWYRNEEPKFCPFCGIKMEVKA